MAHSVSPTSTSPRSGFGRPQLIFFCELPSAELHALLATGDLLLSLAAHDYGVALALRELDETTATVVRVLNSHHVPVVAWLILPPGEGSWLNLQNYPQAIERYRACAAWAKAAGLRFHAIGLDVEPPISELDLLQRWGLRDLARRVWLARENVLFPAARAAYTELIAEIHHDGYEVHTYQLPILADDRRAGTTLAQRALDIVDLPADLEVLICNSSVPLEALGNDLGGALITSYGPAADGIGVGALGVARDAGGENLPTLSWDALERDLLLAARHTDTIYLSSLEGCVERDLFGRLAAFDWDAEVGAALWKRALVGLVRGVILFWLLVARFSGRVFAWLGWGLLALILARRLHFGKDEG